MDFYLKLFIYSAFLFSINLHAATVINSTRVIYLEADKEATVQVSNKGNYAVLLQSWLDNGDNLDVSPEDIKSPFILTPPITRVDANKSQTLRLNYVGEGLKKDEESVLWLNVLEIPPTKADKVENRLQVAFRNRIKVFFRPVVLTGNPAQAAENLEWSISSNKLIVKNSSPFHVSLLSVSLVRNNSVYSTEADMIAPNSSEYYELKKLLPSKGDKLIYEYINDWGAVIKNEKLL